jgi:hypothetical protein
LTLQMMHEIFKFFSRPNLSVVPFTSQAIADGSKESPSTPTGKAFALFSSMSF